MPEMPSVSGAAPLFKDSASGATSRVDFRQVAESVDLPGLLQREEIEVRNGKALCPFHGNSVTPALSVFRADGRWRYKCHACEASGDAIGWVAARENISTIEAARKLSGTADYLVRASSSPSRSAVQAEAPEPWRNPDWQLAVEELVVEAEDRLRGPDGRDALAWLRARGLADHTIRRFRLGFVASHFRSDPVEVLDDDRGPGCVYAPRGITLPWLAPGNCHTDPDASAKIPRWVGCNVRRLADPDVFAVLPDGVDKCLAVRGSRRGYLYPYPEILSTQGEQAMLLVEGEFDALLGVQEVGHLLHVATAGSSSVRSLPLASRSALALSTWIYLALDHDRAGVEAVWEWRERFPHKSRRVLLPFGKDFSDFVMGGGDARAWVAEIERSLTTVPS